MSELQSALPDAAFDGLAQVTEAGLQGMITLRGDFSSRGLRAAVKAAVSVDVPGQRGVALKGEAGAAWMSPDELLLLCPHADAQIITDEIASALKGQHHLVTNVSDARAVFHVVGPSAREVLAKLCPVDFSAHAFGPGQIRRTRMAQIPAAIWMEDTTTFRVVCFRSVAAYAFAALTAAADPAAPVGLGTI